MARLLRLDAVPRAVAAEPPTNAGLGEPELADVVGVRAELPARVLDEIALDRGERTDARREAEAVVERHQGAEGIAGQVGVGDVEDRVLGAPGAEVVDPAHRLLEGVLPVRGDVGAVVGVGERARHDLDQAADRADERDRVAVQQHQPGVGVGVDQRVERQGVVRALQRPAAADAATLQDLQHQPVVVVGRPVVGGPPPRAVRRHVGDRLPADALERLTHHRDALGRVDGRLVVDRADRRVERLEHVDAALRRVHARAAAPRLARRRRSGVLRLPPEQRAVGRVLVEQVREERGAGAEHADHDDRCLDPLRVDLGVLLGPVDDLEPVDQRGGHGRRQRDGAELVELRLAVEAVDVQLQALAEAHDAARDQVLTEVVEPGLLDRGGHDLVDVHRPSSTTVRPEVRRAAWSSSAAPTSSSGMVRPTTGRIEPAATSSSRCSWTRSADVGREAVDAEPAEVARGVEVGEQHAHDGHVRHRQLAQRPAGEPGLGVVVEADREVAPAEGAAGPEHLGLVAADRVEDDVGAAVAGLVHDHVEDVLGGVVDRAGGAELGAERGLLGAAGHRDHPGAGRDRELDGRRTDRAGAAAHQDGLALLERRPARAEPGARRGRAA